MIDWVLKKQLSIKLSIHTVTWTLSAIGTLISSFALTWTVLFMLGLFPLTVMFAGIGSNAAAGKEKCQNL